MRDSIHNGERTWSLIQNTKLKILLENSDKKNWNIKMSKTINKNKNKNKKYRYNIMKKYKNIIKK